MANGAEAEDTTSKFLYAVVEILLDFVNQTNDRDSVVLVNSLIRGNDGRA